MSSELEKMVVKWRGIADRGMVRARAGDEYADGRQQAMRDCADELEATLASLARSGGGEWPARWFASGPQGEFFTNNNVLAEQLIIRGYDRDEWTITDLSLGDTCTHPAAPGKGDSLDGLSFEPDEQHSVADMANVGYSLMQAIARMAPDYVWSESPAEIVSDLINHRDEIAFKAHGYMQELADVKAQLTVRPAAGTADGAEPDDRAVLPVNHVEALDLAIIRQTSSNLARCYIDIHTKLTASSNAAQVERGEDANVEAAMNVCTCPSGDGSLRWPCPKHPPTHYCVTCEQDVTEPCNSVDCATPEVSSPKFGNSELIAACDSMPAAVERGEAVMATGGHWMDAGRHKVYERCAREMESLIEQTADIELDEMTVAALGTARDVLREKATTDKPHSAAHVDVAGWIHEDELPERYPYDAMFPHSKVDIVRIFPVFVPTNPAANSAEGGLPEQAAWQLRTNDGVSWSEWTPIGKICFEYHKANPMPGYEVRALVPEDANRPTTGVLDTSTYQHIEDALDRIEAPMREQGDSGRWLLLHERITAYAREAVERAAGRER